MQGLEKQGICGNHLVQYGHGFNLQVGNVLLPKGTATNFVHWQRERRMTDQNLKSEGDKPWSRANSCPLPVFVQLGFYIFKCWQGEEGGWGKLNNNDMGNYTRFNFQGPQWHWTETKPLIYEQTCRFLCWVVTTETVRPAKQNIFTMAVWIFPEEVCRLLFCHRSEATVRIKQGGLQETIEPKVPSSQLLHVSLVKTGFWGGNSLTAGTSPLGVVGVHVTVSWLKLLLTVPLISLTHPPPRSHG